MFCISIIIKKVICLRFFTSAGRFDEINIGKIGKNDSGFRPQGDYALFHQVYNSGALMDLGKVRVGESKDFLEGYLAGVALGRISEEISIHNGIPLHVREGYYQGVELLPLGKKELEKIVNGLPQGFKLDSAEETFRL